jgi:DNA-binding NarL/FixJ family response regulator
MSAVGGSSAPAGALLDRWPFVGRRLQLDEALAAVADPIRSGVLVAGSPGLGKTRFAQELLAEAAAEGRPTASAQASATVAAVPLGALAHLLPPAVVLADGDGGGMHAVRVLALARQALADADGRLVLHVDDAHLLDAVSLTLLTQVVQDGSVSVVMTVRTGEPLPDALDALCRSDRLLRLDLAPLDDAAVDTLLHLALGAPLDGRANRAITEVAQGNPLFLRELVRAGLDSGALATADGVWRLERPLPPARRVAELYDERLQALDDESRRVLELLAVVGPVPLDLLVQVATFDLLERLEGEGVIELEPAARPGDPELIRLSHPLFAESLRAGVPSLRWRSILAQHADRVDAWPGRRPDDALRIASWRLDAGQPVDPAVLASAAHLARVSLDSALALRLAEAWHRVEPSMTTAALTGEALFELGRWQEAEDVMRDGTGLPGDDDARLKLGHVRTTNLSLGLLRPDDALTSARAELDALGADWSGDPLTPAELRSRIAVVEVFAGRPDAALSTLGELPPPGPQADDARRYVLWAIAGVQALALAGRPVHAVEVARTAMALHQEIGGGIGFTYHYAHRIALLLALQEAGELTEAAASAHEGFAAAVQVGSTLGQTWYALDLGRTALVRGTAATAQRWYREALAASSPPGWLGQRALALSGLAAGNALVGDLDGARAALDQLAGLPGRFGFLEPERAIGEATLLAAEGRLADARELLLAAADRAAEGGQRTVEARLCHEVARLGGARDVLDRLATLAASGDSPLVAARHAHVSAAAARDADALVTAAEELERLGCLMAAGEAFAAAADLVRAAGDQRGANGLAVRATTCLDLCEGARSPVQLPTDAVVPLTTREREIALLAASGVPSKEIAERLYLSVRTVNNHLQNVYTKLGVSSRAELASVLERGPGDHG